MIQLGKKTQLSWPGLEKRPKACRIGGSGNMELKYLFSHIFFAFYTMPDDSGGVLWFHLGHPSVHISFPDDNLSKHQWIFT